MENLAALKMRFKQGQEGYLRNMINSSLQNASYSTIDFSPKDNLCDGKRVSRSYNSIPERYQLSHSQDVQSITRKSRAEKYNVYSRSTLKDYNFSKRLGSGRFSSVYLATHKVLHFQVAIKVLKQSTIKEDELQRQVLREIRIQSKLSHPNIIKLFTHFSDKENIYLVLEYAAGGEVYKLLKKSPMGRFTNSTAAKYIYQVADAVAYCHKNGVIHRDIKPENLILSFDGNIKLSDFGWSVYSPSSRRKTVCGTLDYIAPEMIEEDNYNESIDVWCVGVLCYEFLVGKPPFQGNDKKDTLKKISALRIEYPNHLCPQAKHLISQLLQKDPKNRISLTEVMTHDWIVCHMSPIDVVNYPHN